MREPQHLAAVVLAVVDGLADVAVGFGPRFARLEHLERGEVEAALAHVPGGIEEDLRATFRWRVAPLWPRRQRGTDRVLRVGDRR